MGDSSSLRVFDLFSGIGGFSIALQGVAKTVAYCDCDEGCRSILEARMKSGDLDRGAMMYNDVRAIKGHDIESLGANMITAGFPCVDISVAKPRGRGIRGKGSGLFKEILRLIDESGYSIKVVFLENSANILNDGKGYAYVKREMQRRGFVVKYCVLSAHDVGAFHRRTRWFCLCTRGGDISGRLRSVPNPAFNWRASLKAAEKNKIVLAKDKEQRDQLRRRCAALGNAIVPQCAMVAWNLLIRGQREENRLLDLDTKKPAPLNLRFTDGKNEAIKDYWATPVHSIWHFYHSVTKRGIQLLSNQMYYHEDTAIPAISSEGQYCACNPVFVEALMGYKRNWTRT